VSEKCRRLITYRVQMSFSVIPIIAVATAQQKMTTPKNVWIGRMNARTGWLQTGIKNESNPTSHCSNRHHGNNSAIQLPSE